MPARQRNGADALRHVRHGVQHQLGHSRKRRRQLQLGRHEAAPQEAALRNQASKRLSQNGSEDGRLEFGTGYAMFNIIPFMTTTKWASAGGKPKTTIRAPLVQTGLDVGHVHIWFDLTFEVTIGN